MITEKLIFKIPYETDPLLTWSGIFGANYYDHWRAWDAGSLTLTGALVDSAASLSGSGRAMLSSGINRPSLITDATLGKNVFSFDGVSERMAVLASNGLYNFLHNGVGGVVISVFRVEDVNPDILYCLLDNNNISTSSVGVSLLFDDRSSLSRNNTYREFIVGGTGSFTSLIQSANGYIETQKYISLVSTFDADNATLADRSNIYVNDGLVLNNNSSSGAASIANASFSLTMGSAAGGSLSAKINLAEVIIANTIPTPTQLSQIQARLAYDYGTTFPIT